jgi:hypothetical protein
MFVNGSELNEYINRGPSKDASLTSFDSFGQAVSEEKIFLKINQSETRMACGGHLS